ncbi:hypothetical protein ElyMa_000927700 [Elysia marginata]|uniref:H15 domain-containing protein n=1 Tax=Elysia marginata TaxID=1093978 RepID=A0AAV4HAQ5_9GAST|nr:hypothetical protein ElyMa_000927700 [Elysia marginata]
MPRGSLGRPHRSDSYTTERLALFGFLALTATMTASGASVHELDVCKAIRDIQSPNGSTFNDIKKRLLPSSEANANLQRSFRLALAKGIRSGRIDQDANSLRYRLTNPLEKYSAVGLAKSTACKRKPYCSKNIRKGCRRRYACNRRRGNLPYCSKYQTKCCRRRKKSKCPAKKKPKPKKKKCGKKKRKAPKKKSCPKKPKPACPKKKKKPKKKC